MLASLGIDEKNGVGREWYENDRDVIPIHIDDKEGSRARHLRDQIYLFLHEFTNERQLIDQLVLLSLSNQGKVNSENPAQKTFTQKTKVASHPAKALYMKDILGKL